LQGCDGVNGGDEPNKKEPDAFGIVKKVSSAD
jgi:hypothetical protein